MKKLPQHPIGKARVLTDIEFKRLLKVVSTYRHSKRNTALIYFSFGLGLRAKEMAALTLGDVIDAKGRILEDINLTITKGNRQRHIFLTNPKVRKALTDYLQERKEKKKPCFPGSPLFLSQKHSHFTANDLQALFKRLFLSAGLEGARSHSGRRTFATTLIEQGANIKVIATLMGHASVLTTGLYLENNPILLREVAAGVL